MDSNMFIISAGTAALVIDPNRDKSAMDMLEKQNVTDITIILTHEHFDHISGVNELRELVQDGNCKVIASGKCASMITDPDKNMSRYFEAMFITRSEEDRQQAMKLFEQDYACSADVTFDKNYEFKWQDLTIRLTETLGHSPGSICAEIYDEKQVLLALVTGDSLVQGNKVITRLPGGSKEEYSEQTRPYLERFVGDTPVLPGHGDISLMKDLELG